MCECPAAPVPAVPARAPDPEAFLCPVCDFIADDAETLHVHVLTDCAAAAALHL